MFAFLIPYIVQGVGVAAGLIATSALVSGCGSIPPDGTGSRPICINNNKTEVDQLWQECEVASKKLETLKPGACKSASVFTYKTREVTSKQTEICAENEEDLINAACQFYCSDSFGSTTDHSCVLRSLQNYLFECR